MAWNFGAYQENPTHVHFQNQEEGEEILLLLRQDLATNVGWVLAVLVLLPLPFVLLYVFSQINLSISQVIPVAFQPLAFLSYYMILLAYTLLAFMNWFFNVDIVTPKRVVDITYWGFLFFKVSTAMIENIQDVTYEISGGLGVVFNYGNVHIQTAGTEPNFVFEKIPHPDQVQEKLLSLMRGGERPVVGNG